MRLAALIRNMAEAGATPEAIAIAVEAIEAVEAKAEAGRAAARERKRRQRERDGHGTVTGHDRDSHAAPRPLPSSPQTPQQPTPTPGEITTPARKGPDLTAGFATFWSAYPRKKSKDAAVKAFAKAMRRITEDDPLAVILAGIERALPGWDDPQFIPHPATWLNAAGWEDEAPTVSAMRPRNDRSHQNTRADNRAVWAEVLAESASEGAGSGQPLRIAG